MGRQKPTESKAAMKRRVAKAAKTNGRKAAAGPVIKLTVEDRRWFENVMLKRDLISSEAKQKMAAVDTDAAELAKILSERAGADIAGYDLDWKELTAKPKGKGKAKAVPEPEPQPQPQAEA